MRAGERCGLFEADDRMGTDRERTELRQGGRDRAVRGALWLCGVMRGDERQLDVLVEWEGEDSDGDLRLDSQAAPATGGLRSDF